MSTPLRFALVVPCLALLVSASGRLSAAPAAGSGSKPSPSAPASGAPVKPSTPGAPAPAKPSAAAAAKPLPDSVLARLNGKEDITRRRYLRGVRLLGGDPDSLTPQSRDEFLELVIEQRLLAAEALRKPKVWPRADSLRYRAECDQVLLRAALADEFTRVEDRRRALGQPDLTEQQMGVAARESLMTRVHPAWDEELLKRVGSYFAHMPEPDAKMTLREQMALGAQSPVVPAADSLGVLCRSSLGPFTVADLLADWRRLSPMYRPRVSDAEGVRSLAENSLFERHIRKAAAAPALARRPEVQDVMADRLEYHSVTAYLQQELIDGIPYDSVTLAKHHRANAREFDRPARAVLVVMTLATERSADSLARVFTVPGEAESLAFRAQRGGVNYTHAATEKSDSALYRAARAAGAGAVMGPEQVTGGYRVIKVLSLDPVTPQPLSAVREEVKRSWYEHESERRIRGRLDELRRAARVQRNEKALRSLVLSAPPTPR